MEMNQQDDDPSRRSSHFSSSSSSLNYGPVCPHELTVFKRRCVKDIVNAGDARTLAAVLEMGKQRDQPPHAAPQWTSADAQRARLGLGFCRGIGGLCCRD